MTTKEREEFLKAKNLEVAERIRWERRKMLLRAEALAGRSKVKPYIDPEKLKSLGLGDD
jgi:hypothetical protein